MQLFKLEKYCTYLNNDSPSNWTRYSNVIHVRVHWFTAQKILNEAKLWLQLWVVFNNKESTATAATDATTTTTIPLALSFSKWNFFFLRVSMCCCGFSLFLFQSSEPFVFFLWFFLPSTKCVCVCVGCCSYIHMCTMREPIFHHAYNACAFLHFFLCVFLLLFGSNL